MYIRTRVYIPEVVRFRFEREEKKKRVPTLCRIATCRAEDVRRSLATR